MKTLLIITSVIGLIFIIMLALVAILFILQRKAFNKAVEESDREWEQRRLEWVQKVKDLDDRYEARVKERREQNGITSEDWHKIDEAIKRDSSEFWKQVGK